VFERLRTSVLGFAVTLTIVANVVGVAAGQQLTSPENAPKGDNSNGADIQKAVDQLIQQNGKLEQQNRDLESQNRQLEQQNRELAQKLNLFLSSAGQRVPVQTTAEPAVMANVVEPTPPRTVPATQAQPAQQSSADTPPGKDDKTLLPEASDGNAAIFGEFNPGRGFTVAQGEMGSLNFSGYMVARYLNQLPAGQTSTDHLGRPITVTPRNDFQFHRVMLFTQGWLFDKRFQYSTFLWTVQDTNQVAVGGAIYYRFGKLMTLGGGWNAYPGTMSLQGSHPYWESYDRVMADEFFRPYFSQGVFAQGNLFPGFEYRWMVGNNNSNLDVPAIKLDRDLSGGFAFTWLPTTHEFGPRGAFGDFEDHEKLATRFNLAYTYSPEDRQSPVGTAANNTTLRLADSLNIYDTGAFVNGVTVEHAHYKLLSESAGMKYHGFWLQGEGYSRWLDHFQADGPLPVASVFDSGFYVQLAGMVIPKKLELYGTTSYVFSNYGRPREYIVGTNYYPWHTRNARLNMQLIDVHHSPVSSTFGFYLGQLTGPIFSFGMTAMY
jgi:hypothetical protein